MYSIQPQNIAVGNAQNNAENKNDESTIHGLIKKDDFHYDQPIFGEN